MHQPYYKNLLTNEVELPWVRLHGTKDYLDMVKILDAYPDIHLTINLVPSLVEQIEDYVQNTVKDRFLELSFKPAATLNPQEKEFILDKFFMIFKERVIAVAPRYYELYLKKNSGKPFTTQDYLDLQVWFNLAWIDPYFRRTTPELSQIVGKARFFSEEDKLIVLYKQIDILEDILPTYQRFIKGAQVEVTVSPYYHPILPLLYNTKIAKEANYKVNLPKTDFIYPEDAKAQIDKAVAFYKNKFGIAPSGMWPSEEAVSEHILPFIIQAGINWIISDEAILFKSLKKKKRDTSLIYQPHLLKRKDGNLNVVFRDRNLSDLLSFVYQNFKSQEAVADLMGHLENIHKAFKAKDVLVAIAMDGENAWEYYQNDGWDFLNLLYQSISDSKFIRATTVKEYLAAHPPKSEIKTLAAGSWIFADFFKWIGNPAKNLAWEYLSHAREELKTVSDSLSPQAKELAYKQIYISEGSDWFWWYGENQDDFDRLFRMHLTNFYTIIGSAAPEYLKKPLSA
jgi:alpha-amylase/alpha-mannosidase (GH57 family)